MVPADDSVHCVIRAQRGICISEAASIFLELMHYQKIEIGKAAEFRTASSGEAIRGKP
jgi:hypothetical protein